MYKLVQAELFLARLVMHKYFRAQAVACYVNEYFLYFCLVVWTLQKKKKIKVCLAAETNEAML